MLTFCVSLTFCPWRLRHFLCRMYYHVSIYVFCLNSQIGFTLIYELLDLGFVLWTVIYWRTAWRRHAFSKRVNSAFRASTMRYACELSIAREREIAVYSMSVLPFLRIAAFVFQVFTDILRELIICFKQIAVWRRDPFG